MADGHARIFDKLILTPTGDSKSWFDRIRIYAGVRWFGRSHFNNQSK